MEKPNYQKIYQEIIQRKFSEKAKQTKKLLKKEMDTLDVIKISEILNGKETSENQKHKSYDVDSILKILTIQKNNNYTNTLIAEKFKISRNTVSRWRKIHGF
ncbi:helix-turn-helix domain-containing protein [Empedobacter brevis]|uniref:Transposase n=3 Tax=Empedobacter brevis TaxID=247 RepID=A0A511NKG6_9FLAO|nr:hypothetical protein [Empedobacter brevis]MDM1074242.1 helix-turn-helix domain-containing protein [Empedobacter brevis]QES91372.1 helix-turn-helix domain-containing protein [Empedobacter brevis]QHC86424.1 hypothetical protein AS589_17370 [Empedobacter brevis]GEM53273.1 hypothetical protein EB1_30630 [Empedobacter brevis NBRC 14943 = ATCC 43319]